MILTIEHLLLAFGDTLNDIRLLRLSSLLCLIISITVFGCYIYFIYIASYPSSKKGILDRFKFLVNYKETILKVVTLLAGFILILSLLLFFELGVRHESIRENSQTIFQKIFSEYDGLTESEKDIVKTNARVRWYFERLRRELFEQNEHK